MKIIQLNQTFYFRNCWRLWETLFPTLTISRSQFLSGNSQTIMYTPPLCLPGFVSIQFTQVSPSLSPSHPLLAIFRSQFLSEPRQTIEHSKLLNQSKSPRLPIQSSWNASPHVMGLGVGAWTIPLLRRLRHHHLDLPNCTITVYQLHPTIITHNFSLFLSPNS